jgi:predicted HTH domain antitoxin
MRLKDRLRKIDQLKNKRFPEGNPFFVGGISVDEAAQLIEKDIENIVGELRKEGYAYFNDKDVEIVYVKKLRQKLTEYFK